MDSSDYWKPDTGPCISSLRYCWWGLPSAEAGKEVRGEGRTVEGGLIWKHPLEPRTLPGMAAMETETRESLLRSDVTGS